jgi:hypothetical protein
MPRVRNVRGLPGQRTVTLALMLLGSLTPTGCRRRATPPRADDGAVPAEFRALHAALDRTLAADQARIAARWDGRPRHVVLGAELIAANGNRGVALLEPRAMTGVRALLDGFQAMGVRGVSVAIPYPLLLPGTPRSDEYAAFYRQVAEEVRRRGMVLLVKSGPVFPQREFSDLPVRYAGLTMARFTEEWRVHIHRAVAITQPDWVSVFNEPGTMGDVLGLRFGPSEERAIVARLLAGWDHGGARVAAGAGSWDDEAYFRELATLPGLDALATNVYPVERGWFVSKLDRIAQIAHGAGKRVIVPEAWLLKAQGAELATGVASTPALFARDAFAFWAPLDTRFLETLVTTAWVDGIDYVSPFWVRHLWAYLPYDARVRRMAPAARFREADRAFVAALLAQRPSPTGVRWRELATTTPVPERRGR